MSGLRRGLCAILTVMVCGAAGAGLMSQAAAAATHPPALEEAVEEQLGALDTRELEEVLRSIEGDLRRYLPDFDLRRLTTDGEGLGVDAGSLLAALFQRLLGEVWQQGRLLGQLMVLGVLCALLQSLAGAFANRGAGDVAFLAAFLVVIFLALQSFRVAVDIGQRTLDTMVSFMLALLPMLSTMLAAVGALSSAAIFHPLLITVVSLVASLVSQVVFPLLFFSAALGVIAPMASEFPLSRLAGLLRQAGVITLGLLFTVFLGVMVVRGAIAPVADGVALRTAKFLTGTFVPVIGGMLADAVEVVVGGSLLIKNAIGAFGLLAIFVLGAFPLMKILALVIIYRLVTALIQPISDPRLVESLGCIAESLTVLAAAVATAALMFFVAVTVIISIGNVAAMVR